MNHNSSSSPSPSQSSSSSSSAGERLPLQSFRNHPFTLSSLTPFNSRHHNHNHNLHNHNHNQIECTTEDHQQQQQHFLLPRSLSSDATRESRKRRVAHRSCSGRLAMLSSSSKSNSRNTETQRCSCKLSTEPEGRAEAAAAADYQQHNHDQHHQHHQHHRNHSSIAWLYSVENSDCYTNLCSSSHQHQQQQHEQQRQLQQQEHEQLQHQPLQHQQLQHQQLQHQQLQHQQLQHQQLQHQQLQHQQLQHQQLQHQQLQHQPLQHQQLQQHQHQQLQHQQLEQQLQQENAALSPLPCFPSAHDTQTQSHSHRSSCHNSKLAPAVSRPRNSLQSPNGSFESAAAVPSSSSSSVSRCSFQQLKRHLFPYLVTVRICFPNWDDHQQSGLWHSDFILSRATSENLEDYKAILSVLPIRQSSSSSSSSSMMMMMSPSSSLLAEQDRRVTICVIQALDAFRITKDPTFSPLSQSALLLTANPQSISAADPNKLQLPIQTASPRLSCTLPNNSCSMTDLPPLAGTAAGTGAGTAAGAGAAPSRFSSPTSTCSPRSPPQSLISKQPGKATSASTGSSSGSSSSNRERESDQLLPLMMRSKRFSNYYKTAAVDDEKPADTIYDDDDDAVNDECSSSSSSSSSSAAYLNVCSNNNVDYFPLPPELAANSQISQVDSLFPFRRRYKVYQRDQKPWCCSLQRESPKKAQEFFVMQLLQRNDGCCTSSESAEEHETSVSSSSSGLGLQLADVVFYWRWGENSELNGNTNYTELNCVKDGRRLFKETFYLKTGNNWRGSLSKTLSRFIAVKEKFVLQDFSGCRVSLLLPLRSILNPRKFTGH